MLFPCPDSKYRCQLISHRAEARFVVCAVSPSIRSKCIRVMPGKATRCFAYPCASSYLSPSALGTTARHQATTRQACTRTTQIASFGHRVSATTRPCSLSFREIYEGPCYSWLGFGLAAGQLPAHWMHRFEREHRKASMGVRARLDRYARFYLLS